MQLPKYDVHRHMGGSISPMTVWKIIETTKDFRVATDYDEICGRMTFKDGESRNFQHFLSKFTLLDVVKWPDWAVELAIIQICRDLESDGIAYSAISLSIDKYVRSGAWTVEEIIEFIYNKFREHGKTHNTHVDLLLALPYHASKESQRRSSSIIRDNNLSSMFKGIDLVGDEHYFDPEFYVDILEPWREQDKIVRAHVGELPNRKDNVSAAINYLPLTNIAHGIFADDETLIKATDHGITFDLALHSNYYTGAVQDVRTHPINHMLQMGCRVTLNTDDPVQFGCTLDQEFKLALDSGLITEEQVLIIRENAIEAFRPSKSTVK